jgi:hypothetical protein
MFSNPVILHVQVLDPVVKRLVFAENNRGGIVAEKGCSSRGIETELAQQSPEPY